MKLWIARDEGNAHCNLHLIKPSKYYDKYQRRWKWLAEPYYAYLGLPDADFPEVTFENSPMEVELVLKV